MSNSPVKYRHPGNHELEWSGKGRQPKWVEAYLANGGSMVSLDVSVQLRDEMEQLEDALDAAEMESDGIDLGIGDSSPAVFEPNYQIVADTSTDEARQSIARDAAMLIPDESSSQQVSQLAKEIGYNGSPTIGSLEDEIRFYQRRTVEACLELGKRLLLLKAMTPHGEFEKRLSLLGIENTKAQRFMKAAGATAKSSNLQLLSDKTKSFSAFFEIVMTDDEVVENILEWDDVDRLSASQLRARVREYEQSINRLQTDLNTAQSRLSAEAKTLPPPLLSREVDKQIQSALNAEAMGAAAVDLLNRQISDMAAGGDFLAERAATLHSCLCALASRVSVAFSALQAVADDCDVSLPKRPQMVVSEEMAREYLAAHTGYIETAIELVQKQQIARGEVLGRGRGRPAGSKNNRKAGEA